MDKIKRTQAQIDDVTYILRENIEAVAQRGERLEVLQGKTGKSQFCVLGGAKKRQPGNLSAEGRRVGDFVKGF